MLRLSFLLKLSFSTKLNRFSYINLIAKTAYSKIGASTCSVKFLFAEVSLYLCGFITQHCMEYCFHAWTGAPNIYLDILSKLQKREDRIAAPTIASSLEPLVHCWNVVDISCFFFTDITVGNVHRDLLNWLLFIILAG